MNYISKHKIKKKIKIYYHEKVELLILFTLVASFFKISLPLFMVIFLYQIILFFFYALSEISFLISTKFISEKSAINLLSTLLKSGESFLFI